MFQHRSPRKPIQDLFSGNPTFESEPRLFSRIDLRAVKPLDTLRAHEVLDFDYSVLMQSQPRPASELRFTLVDLLSKRNRQIAGEYGFGFMAVASTGSAGVTWNDSAAITFDLDGFRMLAQLERLGEGRFNNLVVSPNGNLVAGLVGDRRTVWASKTGRVQWSEAASGSNEVPRFSADSGRLFFAQGLDILVIDIGTWKPIARLQHQSPPMVGGGASSSDLFAVLLHVDSAGKRAIVRLQHAVYVWDVEAGTSQRLDDIYAADKAQYETDVAQLKDASVSVATLMSTARRKLNECPAQ
ncbi:MAG: hypothetical protein AB7S70_03195 [Hyphomicrobium sp.]|uniref:hypothetical protein n=1 Tax=Hyphomicrobium sp. TaxID=82 RepID=UPI003D116035